MQLLRAQAITDGMFEGAFGGFPNASARFPAGFASDWCSDSVSFRGARVSLRVLTGVSAGLVLGKPIGVLGFSWLATRLGLAALPRGVAWPHVGVVGVVAGIGFTMSIFIAALAFPPGTNLETAKVAVLIGSGLAAVLAYGLGRMILRSTGAAGALTAAEAEAPTTS